MPVPTSPWKLNPPTAQRRSSGSRRSLFLKLLTESFDDRDHCLSAIEVARHMAPWRSRPVSMAARRRQKWDDRPRTASRAMSSRKWVILRATRRVRSSAPARHQRHQRQVGVHDGQPGTIGSRQSDRSGQRLARDLRRIGGTQDPPNSSHQSASRPARSRLVARTTDRAPDFRQPIPDAERLHELDDVQANDLGSQISINAANSVDSTTRTVYIRNCRSTPPAAATTPTTSLAKRKPHGRRCRDRLRDVSTQEKPDSGGNQDGEISKTKDR